MLKRKNLIFNFTAKLLLGKLLHGETFVGEVAVFTAWGICWGLKLLLGKILLEKLSRGSFDWGNNLTSYFISEQSSIFLLHYISFDFQLRVQTNVF